MKKYFQHPLSKQFRDRCMNMTAWAEKNGISKELLSQISAGRVKGKRNGLTKQIIEKLKNEGFTFEDVA
ncbi:hypothetical protein [Sulfurospirillum cavolei]|uniref:hypothetical protein n=1 Tax=Sulfurospirillum cavolei TaxID=366522 RepID=UPI0005A9937B|nr:hypothetical protein [Sulfurospirillum cavolei]